jgi:hypothetical protein
MLCRFGQQFRRDTANLVGARAIEEDARMATIIDRPDLHPSSIRQHRDPNVGLARRIATTAVNMRMHREHAEVALGVPRVPLLCLSPHRSLSLLVLSFYDVIKADWYKVVITSTTSVMSNDL